MKDFKYRSMSHMVLLYTDNSAHMESLEIVRKSYDYALIKHDKDLDKDSNLKKEHIHIVLRFPSQKWNTSLSKELKLDIRFIEECRNFNNALLYLVHFNEPNKHQYSIEEVEGNLKVKMNELMNRTNKTESEKVIEIMDIIDTSDYLTLGQLSRFCASNGYWSEFRRASFIFNQMLQEHNELIKGVEGNE